MKRIGILFLFSLTYCSFTFGATAAESTQRAAAVAYGNLPLSFEANKGQVDPQIRFTSRGNGYSLALTDSGAVLSLRKPAPVDKSGVDKPKGTSLNDTVRMDLVAPIHLPQVVGAGTLPGTANYFIGNDASNWRTNVPTYSQVKYTGVYPGVDLVYYGNQRQLEYDFVLAPHADPNPVKLHFSGAQKLMLERNGDLTVVAKNGSIAFHKPVVYQIEHGRKTTVAARFMLLPNQTIGFALASYDHSRELVIDPTLAYSSYIGGGGGADEVRAVSVDAQGNVYLAGEVNSLGFPTTPGAFQSTLSSPGLNHNTFVAKMNAAGDGLIYSTFIVGNIEEIANALAVDAQGDAYVAGMTTSTAFPTTPGAFQPTLASFNLYSGFVTKINPKGSGLIYSTYLTGTKSSNTFVPVIDQVNAIALDSAGDAYVTGSANSVNFPVTSDAFQKINKAAALSAINPNAGVSATNAFVTEFNPSGSALLYSSYLGGTGTSNFVNINTLTSGDAGKGIAVDVAGYIYVTGRANSADFPVTRNALQKTNEAFVNSGANAFVVKINPHESALAYSTYIGGSGFIDLNEGILTPGDSGNAIAVDAEGRAIIAGSASSLDFPVTSRAFQRTKLAVSTFATNAIIARLNPGGSALEFSTYLGGSGIVDSFGHSEGESANGIAIDSDGSVYVAGTAWSSDLPVTKDAFQSHNRAAGLGLNNAFVAKIDGTGSTLQYATYLGGSGQPGGDFFPLGGDLGLAMALSTNGDLYVGGAATSLDYPVSRDAFQKVNNDYTSSGFVAKFAIGGIKEQTTKTTVTASSDPQRAGAKVTFNASVTSASGSAVPTGFLNVTVNGQFFVKLPLDGTGHATYTSIPLPAGCYNIAVVYSGDKADLPSRTTLVEIVKPGK